MKSKLLYVMMGTHNPEMLSGLQEVFDCVSFDWTLYGENSYPLQTELLNLHNSFNPEFVFMHTQSGNVVQLETLSQMAKTSKIVNWTGDVRFPLPQHYIEAGRIIHLTLFTNMNDVNTCNQLGVKADFLQVGFDKTHFNPLGHKGIYPEIIFLGSNYGDMFPLSSYRREMVNRLKNEFGNRFGFYGGGWEETQQISNNSNNHLPHLFNLQHLQFHLQSETINKTINTADGNITTYAEEGKAYRSCKIAINLSHFAYSRYSSDRMFRILGTGAFCLTHRFPDIEQDFKVGEELVCWENIDDLINKIKYYLENDREREIIAIKGCGVARTRYTWLNFAENLQTILNK